MSKSISFMTRVTGGKEVIETVEELKTENSLLIRVVEEQGALISVLREEIADIKTYVAEIKDVVTDTNTKHFVGKKPEFLPGLMEEVKQMTPKQIRSVLWKASGNQQDGYNRIYAKLSDMVGFNVKDHGKSRILKRDNLGFTNNGESYINTLFKKGVECEAAAIALDIIRNK